jgi:hypothetical protein
MTMTNGERRTLGIPRRIATEVVTLADGRLACAVGSEVDLEDEFAMQIAPALLRRWGVSEMDDERMADIADRSYRLARALCLRRLAGAPLANGRKAVNSAPTREMTNGD